MSLQVITYALQFIDQKQTERSIDRLTISFVAVNQVRFDDLVPWSVNHELRSAKINYGNCSLRK